MYLNFVNSRPREVRTIIKYLHIFKNQKPTDAHLRICESYTENIIFKNQLSFLHAKFKNEKHKQDLTNENQKIWINRHFSVHINEKFLTSKSIQKILHKKHYTSLSERTVQEMEKHQVVPDVIDSAPSKIIDVSYSGVKVDLGNELTPTQVQNIPEVNWDAQEGTYYTLIMTDPDAPSRKDPKYREFHHWSVGNILGSDVSSGETLSQYVGAGPPKGTGLHRYVFLVYKQPGKLTFDEPRLTNTSSANRPKFSAKDFAAKYNMELVFGNFFQAQHDSYVEKLHAQLSGV